MAKPNILKEVNNMRITGKRASYNGREITGLVDYNEEKNVISFTTFYRIELDKTKTFCWITEINENFKFDVESANSIVQQITAILGADELKIFIILFKKLKENLNLL